MSWKEIIKNDESDSRCKHRDWIITKLEQNVMTDFKINSPTPEEGYITFTTKCLDCNELGYITFTAKKDYMQWDDDGE